MNWTFDTITPRRPALEPHSLRLEHHTLKWVKGLARRRNVPSSQAIRELLSQAVRHWRQNGHTSGSPWGDGVKVGLRGSDVTTALLDEDTLSGLREIMAASGKTLSRVISEILLDAMVAETASMRADLVREQPVRNATAADHQIGMSA